MWLPAGVAIVKNAPNMDNAKLFVDYVLSEEAQTALSKTTIRGTMTSIAQDCPEMKPFEEINVVYEDQPLWQSCRPRCWRSGPTC